MDTENETSATAETRAGDPWASMENDEAQIAQDEVSEATSDDLTDEALADPAAAVETEAAEVETEADASNAAAPLSEEDLRINAAALAAGVPADQLGAFREMVAAEQAKLAEAQAEQEAQEASQAITESLRPYAEQLQARTQLDPSDPNYLPASVAEEMWATRWSSEEASRRIAEYEAKIAEFESRAQVSERESNITRIVAEFPDADELVIRTLIEAGRPASEVQSIAQRITDRVKSAASVEVSRHVAQTTATKKTVATPGAGLPSGAGNRSPKSLGEAME